MKPLSCAGVSAFVDHNGKIAASHNHSTDFIGKMRQCELSYVVLLSFALRKIKD